MIVTNILEENKIKYGHKRAYTMHQGYRTYTLTYAQVHDRAHRIAQLLAEKGISKGDLVLIIAGNSPQWACIFWACLLRGAVVVPLNAQSMPSMIELVIKQTHARVAFVDRYNRAKMPDTIQVFSIEALESLIEQYSGCIEPVSVSQDDIIEIMYTSGTTSDPKGVMITYGNIWYTLEGIIAHYKDGFSASLDTSFKKYLSVLPLSHISEQVCSLYIYQDVREIVFSHSSTKIMRLIQDYHIVEMGVVPEFLYIIMSRIRMQVEENGKCERFKKALWLAQRVNQQWFSRLLFRQVHKALGGSLHIIFSGGSSLNEQLHREWHAMGITILSGYGLTETTGPCIYNNCRFLKIGSVGKPFKHVQLQIASDGEILIKGPTVFKGYFKNERATAEAFTPDGWFKTGDFGEIDSEGFLFIRGRKKYMIKSAGGQNVFPEDIEEVLKYIKGVKACCVVGITLSDELTEIHASLILDEYNHHDHHDYNSHELYAKKCCVITVEDRIKDIVDQANTKLATYQRINGWSVWPEEDFPRTAIKKIKKNDVIDYLLSKHVSDENVHKEKNNTHKEYTALINIVASITGISHYDIKPESRLINDLKLDSLMRVELLARIEESLYVVLEESVISPETTIADVQIMIKEKKPIKPSPPISTWSRSLIARGLRRLLQPIIFCIIRFFIKLEVRGLEHIHDVQEPVVFMPNHISDMDAVLVAMAVPAHKRYTLSFAAARDALYEKLKPFSFLCELILNTFPIQRIETRKKHLTHQNIKLGFEYIGKMIDWGYSVVLFPEGRLGSPNTMLQFKQGAGLVALEMGCCVVPVKISSNAGLWSLYDVVLFKRGVVTITFGKPIKMNSSTLSYGQATEVVQQCVFEL
jgi:long-chain acyl-CoA synthetase